MICVGLGRRDGQVLRVGAGLFVHVGHRVRRQHGAAAVMGVHRRGDGQADAQRMLGQLRRIQRDLHRQALHDLDPVARGILRRQQRERRAGAGRQADDMAVEHHVTAIQVGDQRGRLSEAQVAQLAFLEVRVQPHVLQRDDGQQSFARCDALAQLHAALGHDSRPPVRPRSCASGPARHPDRRCWRPAPPGSVPATRRPPARALRRACWRACVSAASASCTASRAWRTSSPATACWASSGSRLARSASRACQLQFALGDAGVVLHGLRLLHAHLAHGLRQLGGGARQALPGVGVVELEQRLAGARPCEVLRTNTSTTVPATSAETPTWLPTT